MGPLPLSPIQYAIPAKALDKWARADVTCAIEGDGALHCHYLYFGSTCNDGGQAFTATFHVVLRSQSHSLVIENAWVDLPLENNPGALQMCAYQTQREPFLRELRDPPSFCGMTLEDAIARKLEFDYAGCLCFEAMLNHKWRNVLSAIHFALSQGILSFEVAAST